MRTDRAMRADKSMRTDKSMRADKSMRTANPAHHFLQEPLALKSPTKRYISGQNTPAKYRRGLMFPAERMRRIRLFMDKAASSFL